MKKSILILLLFTLLSWSCNDTIDLNPISELSSAVFYENQEDLEKAVNSAYASLQSDGQYGQDFSYLMTVRSDVSTTQSLAFSGSIYGDIESSNLDPLNFIIQRSWKDLYAGIQRCNIVLNRINTVEFEEDLKALRIGEVKFLRSLMYFNALRLWGDIPLVLNETEDPLSLASVPRTSIERVYEQIIMDLEASIESLPEKDNQELGRVNKEAAKVLLAKIYLTRKEYDKSSSILSSLIGVYSLLTNYKDIFDISNKNNEESIFEIQFDSNLQGEGSMYSNLFAPSNKDGDQLVNGTGKVFGLNLPTEEFYASFSENDVRKEMIDRGEISNILYQRKYVDPSPVFNPAKFTKTDCNNNFIVFRYADVLLMLAEVYNELGYTPNGEAFDYLNQIRLRAGLNAYSSTDLPDQKSFREAVLEERKFELAFENHRWFDLLRSGKAVEVMNNHTNMHGQYSVSNYQLLYPIPQSQIDASSINQNPGY